MKDKKYGCGDNPKKTRREKPVEKQKTINSGKTPNLSPRQEGKLAG